MTLHLQSPGRAVLIPDTLLAASLACAVVVAQGTTQVVRLQIPDWVTNPRCAVSGGRGDPAPLRGSELTFTCTVALRPSPADPAPPVVSCDFVGAEPVEVPLADLCRTRTLPPQRSKEVAVTSEIAVDLTVEWVDFPVGPARTLAARNYRLAAGAPLTLEVARTDGGFLRFSRQGAPPANVSRLDVPTLKPRPLPSPVPGGEWFARVEPASIVAERYRVTGPWSGELRPSARPIVARQGLPAGDHQIVPVYRGGPNGRPIAVRIVNAQANVGVLSHEAVRAVAPTAGTSSAWRAGDLFAWSMRARAVTGG